MTGRNLERPHHRGQGGKIDKLSELSSLRFADHWWKSKLVVHVDAGARGSGPIVTRRGPPLLIHSVAEHLHHHQPQRQFSPLA